MPADESTVQISVAESAENAASIRRLADALRVSVDNLVGVSDSFRTAIESLFEAAKVIESAGGEIANSGAVSGASHELVTGTDENPMSEVIEDNVRAISAMSDGMDATSESLDSMSESVSTATENVDGLTDATERASDGMSDVTEALVGAGNNDVGMAQAVEDTTGSVSDFGNDVESASKKVKGAADSASESLGNIGGLSIGDAAGEISDAGEAATTLADRISGVRGFDNPLTKATDRLSGIFGDLGLELGGADGLGGLVGKLTKFGGAIGIAASAVLAIGGIVKEGIDMYQTARDVSIDQTGRDGDLTLGAREFAQAQFASFTSGLSEEEATSIQESLISARLPFGSTGAGGSYEEGFAFSQNARLNYGLDANQAVKLYVDQVRNQNKSVEEVNAHLERLAEISEKTGITLSELHEDFNSTAQKLERSFGDSGTDAAMAIESMFGSDEELQKRADEGDARAEQMLAAKSFVTNTLGSTGFGPGTLAADIWDDVAAEMPGADSWQIAVAVAQRAHMMTRNGGKGGKLFETPLTDDGKTFYQYIESGDYDGLEDAIRRIYNDTDGTIDWNKAGFQQELFANGYFPEGVDDPKNVRDYVEMINTGTSPENVMKVNQENEERAQAAQLTEQALGTTDLYNGQSIEEFSMNQDSYLGGYASGLQNATYQKGVERVRDYIESGHSADESRNLARADLGLSENPLFGSFISPLSQPLSSDGKSFRDYYQQGDFDGLKNAIEFAKNNRPEFWARVVSALRGIGISDEISSDTDSLLDYVRELKGFGSAGSGSEATSETPQQSTQSTSSFSTASAGTTTSAANRSVTPSIESSTASTGTMTSADSVSGGGSSIEELVESENYGKLGDYVTNVGAMSDEAFNIAKDKLAEYYPKIASMDTAAQVSEYLKSGEAEKDMEEKQKELNVNIELAIEGELGEVLHRKMVRYEWRNKLDENEGA